MPNAKCQMLNGSKSNKKGKRVRKPTTNEKLTKKNGGIFSLISFLTKSAEVAPQIKEPNIKRFPINLCSPWPLCEIGSRAIIRDPKKAIAIPIFSFIVTCSFKKKAPNVTIKSGPKRERRLISRRVVLSVPQNNNPKVAVEFKKPYRRSNQKFFFKL